MALDNLHKCWKNWKTILHPVASMRLWVKSLPLDLQYIYTYSIFIYDQEKPAMNLLHLWHLAEIKFS